MVTIDLHALAPRIIIGSILIWNGAFFVSLTQTTVGVMCLVYAQTYLLRLVCHLLLGHINALDQEALGIDVDPLSMTFWVAILGVHASGFSFAPRHLLLLGIQRLLRVPMVCASLWPTLNLWKRLRLAFLAYGVSAVALLACAYWLTDPFGDHPSQPVLVADGLCAFVTATFEMLMLVWVAFATWRDRPQPERNDTSVLRMRCVEAMLHVVVTAAAVFQPQTWLSSSSSSSSGGRVVFSESDGPPIHVQIIMLKRLWIAASCYSQYRRSMTVLAGVPHVPADELGRDCTICLEPLTPGSRQLPCGHCFHERCLHHWLMTTPVCPLCRRRFHSVLQAGGEPVAVPTPGVPNATADRVRQYQQQQQEAVAAAAAADDDDEEGELGEPDVVFTVPHPWPFGGGGGGAHPPATENGAANRGNTPPRQAAAAAAPRPRRDLLDSLLGTPVAPEGPRGFPTGGAANGGAGPRVAARRGPPPAPWSSVTSNASSVAPSTAYDVSAYPSPVANAGAGAAAATPAVLAQSAVLRRALADGLVHAARRRPRRPRNDSEAEASPSAAAAATSDFSAARTAALAASRKHARTEAAREE